MYHVVEIIDGYTVLINYGIQDGAKKDQQVRIYTPGETVKDPITGTSLGTLDIVKADLTIITAYPQFSLCQKIGFNALPALSPLATLVRQMSTEPLSVDRNEISNRKIPKAAPIKIGDPVMVISKIV